MTRSNVERKGSISGCNAQITLSLREVGAGTKELEAGTEAEALENHLLVCSS